MIIKKEGSVIGFKRGSGCTNCTSDGSLRVDVGIEINPRYVSCIKLRCIWFCKVQAAGDTEIPGFLDDLKVDYRKIKPIPCQYDGVGHLWCNGGDAMRDSGTKRMTHQSYLVRNAERCCIVAGSDVCGKFKGDADLLGELGYEAG